MVLGNKACWDIREHSSKWQHDICDSQLFVFVCVYDVLFQRGVPRPVIGAGVTLEVQSGFDFRKGLRIMCRLYAVLFWSSYLRPARGRFEDRMPSDAHF